MLRPSVFELYALAIFVVSSSCQSASPFRQKNILSGGGNWKNILPKPRTGSAKNILRVTENSVNTVEKQTDATNSSLSSSSFFAWEASIDGPTGVASSNERSGPFSLTTEKFPRWLSRKRKTPTKLVSLSQEEQERIHQVVKEEEDQVVEMSREFVETWSEFLCRVPISLGILRCEKEIGGKYKKRFGKLPKIRLRRKNMKSKPSSNEACNADSMVSSSSLMARFVPFPVKLLEFGKVVESSSPSISSVQMSQKKHNEYDDNNLVVLGSWDIPLKGGTLILQDDVETASDQSTTSSNPDYLGKLTFTIAKTKQMEGDVHEHGGGDDASPQNSYKIMTGIVDYRPWLAGGGYTSDVEKTVDHKIWDALKANREATTRKLCHAFYLSTQSMVHAYVTWRFHNAWRQKLKANVRTTRSRTVENMEPLSK